MGSLFIYVHFDLSMRKGHINWERFRLAVPFKSKLTTCCESWFLTWFTILDSCTNGESRASYRESSRGPSLSGQKTKDAPTQRPTAVTQYGMVIHVFAQATVCSKLEHYYLSECFSRTRTSVSRFISSSKVSNACFKCKQCTCILVCKQQHFIL